MNKLDTDIRIRMTDKNKGELEDLAYSKGFNVSTYIRYIINEKIKEWQAKQ